MKPTPSSNQSFGWSFQLLSASARNRGRAALANTAVAVVSTMVTALVLWAGGEAVLRWQYGSLPTQSQVGMRVHHDERGWALRPGRYAYFDVRAARRVDVAINDLGLRNEPLSLQPRPGTERLTLLGDSFVFGAPVQAQATIGARLQTLAGTSYEIVNAGIPGYGTGQQYLLLEELRSRGYSVGRKLVLVFFTNDLQDNLGLDYSSLARNHAQPAFSVDAAGNLQHIAPRPSHGAQRENAGSVLERSLFAQFVRYQIEVLMVSNPRLLDALEALGMAPELPRTPGIVAGWYGPQWQQMWAVTEGVLEHMVRKLRKAGQPELYIAFAPSPFQVHESFKRTLAAGAHTDARYAAFLSDPDRPQRLLEALARRLEVPFIDLSPAVRRAAEHSMVYYPREGHFNELGCAIAAQAIFEQVIKNPR